MPKCAYCGERIREIEGKWIGKNVEDGLIKIMKLSTLYNILKELKDKADCKFEAIEGKEFCIFHDPEYWKSHKEEVRERFLELLNTSEEKYFIGFNLPSITFPKEVKGELHMELAKFHEKLIAENTEFHDFTHFTNANFMASIFDNSIFHKPVNFSGAVFQGITAFKAVTFKDKADFSKTNFQVVFFDKAVFQTFVSFAYVDIFSMASFHKTMFYGNVNFYDIIFNQNVFFVNATFKASVYFRSITFQESVNFSKAMFDGRLHFKDTNFRGPTKFNKTTFDRAYFENVIFEKSTLFEELDFKENGLIIFESSSFKNPRLTSFEGTDMCRFLFLNTDIDKINLSNTYLCSGLLKAHELLRRHSSETFSFDDVIETYGRFRGNLEKNHRFSDAGVFFKGEMEARRERIYYERLRKNGKKGESNFKGKIFFRIRKSLLWLYVKIFSPYALYKHFSNYGESWKRPIAWIFATIFIMPIFYTLLRSQPLNLNQYLENLKLSALLFFQLAPIEYSWPGSIIFLSILERILGILFPALEVLALKRTLERHP